MAPTLGAMTAPGAAVRASSRKLESAIRDDHEDDGDDDDDDEMTPMAPSR